MGENESKGKNENRRLECIIVLETFFKFKKELHEFSQKAKQLTNKYEQMISWNFPKDMIDCVDLIYEDMRFQTDCKIGKFTKTEKECRKLYGCAKLKECLEIPYEEKIAYSKLSDSVRLKGKPLLTFLDDYKKDIINLYQQYVPFLWHISAVPNIKFLKPSLQRENMYYNEVSDAVFTISNYEEILLYIGRTSGNEMVVINDLCFYKKKPYSSWNKVEIHLKNKAVIYYIDTNGFEPVIDFVVTGTGKISLKFGHEWINRSKVPVCKKEEIAVIPSKDMYKYHLFFGLNDENMGVYTNYLKQEYEQKKREKYLQKLVDDKIIAYVNLS